MPTKITMAIGNRYDTKYLLRGDITVEGFDVQFIDAGPAPAPIFNKMVTTIPYDLGEQSIANYIIARDAGRPLTALPIFPSRFFPHLGLTVRRDSGLHRAEDLVGKRIGSIQGFAANPAVWLRTILVHQYDFSAESMTWVVSERDSLAGVNYPRSRRYNVKQERDLPRLLDEGKIDALMSSTAGVDTPHSRHLFEKPEEEARAFVALTGEFPLNTVLTAKEDLLVRHPGLAERIMEACQRARKRYFEEMQSSGEREHMGVPLSLIHDLGVFPDMYGLKANERGIQLAIHACYEQGLIRRLYSPRELFFETSA